jgi:hypothetical protein
VTQHADGELLDLLMRREGIPTLVTLNSGLQVTVHNIAWGYDIGDQYAHVTTNISPRIASASIDFFFTSDIRSIADSVLGESLA